MLIYLKLHIQICSLYDFGFDIIVIFGGTEEKWIHSMGFHMMAIKIFAFKLMVTKITCKYFVSLSPMLS